MVNYEPDFIKRSFRQFVNIIQRIILHMDQGEMQLAEHEILQALQSEFGLTPALRPFISTEELLETLQLGIAYDGDRLLFLAELFKLLAVNYQQKGDHVKGRFEILQALEILLTALRHPAMSEKSKIRELADELLSLISPAECPVELMLDFIDSDLASGQYVRALMGYRHLKEHKHISKDDLKILSTQSRHLQTVTPSETDPANQELTALSQLIRELSTAISD